MSQQPDKPKPTGSAALQAAADKTKTRRAAPVVPRERRPGAVPPPPPPPAPAPAPVEKAPEIPQEPANTVPQGKDTGATVTALPTAQQPPVVQEQPVVPQTVAQPQPPAVPVIAAAAAPAAVPSAPAVIEPAPVVVQPTAPVVAQPSLSDLLRKRPQSAMTPVQLQMYLNALGKNFKSVANIIRMLSERADEASALIEEATGKGLPDDEIERLAITHGIRDWLPFILSVGDEQQ